MKTEVKDIVIPPPAEKWESHTFPEFTTQARIDLIAAALTGLCANPSFNDRPEDQMAKAAILQADHVLALLHEERKPKLPHLEPPAKETQRFACHWPGCEQIATHEMISSGDAKIHLCAKCLARQIEAASFGALIPIAKLYPADHYCTFPGCMELATVRVTNKHNSNSGIYCQKCAAAFTGKYKQLVTVEKYQK